MKHHSTRIYRILTALYIGFPITYLVFAGVVFNIPLTKCFGILLSPIYYLLGSVAVAAGVGLWEMRWWSWYLFILANGLVLYGNAWVSVNYGQSNHPLLAFVLSVLAVLGIVFRVSKEIKVPYILPRIRWWETNPRYRFSTTTIIERQDGSAPTGEMLDLTMGGCFVKLREEFTADEEVTVVFNLFGQNLRLKSNIVWKAHSAVTHPKGVGIKFHALKRYPKRALRAILAQLRKITQLHQSSRYLMSQEEFIKSLDELESMTIQIRHRKKTKLE